MVDKKEKEVRDIDYSAIFHGGPLYVAPKHMKPGFKYALPTNRPGEIEYFKRLGYEIVKDDSGEVTTGSDKPSVASPLGTAVTIQSKCGVLHVLMEIPEELHAKFMKFMAEKNKQQMGALGHVSDIPAHLQYGGVTFDNKRV